MSENDDGSATDGAVRRGLRSTFGLLTAMKDSPGVSHVFFFAIGAVLSFTLLEGLLSRGFRRPMPQHHTRVQAVGTSLNMPSVIAGLGSAWLAATWISHSVVWAVAPFLAAIVYLVLESLETALAERLLKAAKDPEADDVSS